MRTPRTTLMLWPAGLTLGHAFGYLMAGDDHHVPGEVAHGYLDTVVRLALPLALGAVAWAFVGGARRVAPRGPRWRRLALQQTAAFLLMEVAEHALAGHTPQHALHALHAPTTLWGIVGQALAAGLVVAALRTAHAAGRRVAPERRVAPPVPPARSFPRPAAARMPARDVAATWALRRAPPAVAA
jgi:hypothetical protein